MALSLNAADITFRSKGALGALGSIDFGGLRNSFIGVYANVEGGFTLKNGLEWGIGAIGGWAAYQEWQPLIGGNNNLPYASSGDASKAYIGYTNKLIVIYAGRFANDFTRFDWLQGGVQGLSLRFSTYDDKMSYWITYANSYLYNGKQDNAFQGNRIAADLTSLSAFNPDSKNSLVGGEIIAGGLDFNVDKFLLQPFVFINTNAMGSRHVLFQAGLKGELRLDITDNLLSTTILHAMYQYWDVNGVNNSASSVLLWGDETLCYKMFLFGAGVFGIISNRNAYIYALSDSSKFYGRSFFGGSSALAPYFAGHSLSGYIFGGINLKGEDIRIDAMVSFGSYEEYSLVSTFKIWKQDDMRLDAGIGYAYVESRNRSFGNALNIFVRFAY